MKYKIKIKKYTENETISWEERYKQLESHHLAETQELIKRINDLERYIEEIYNDDLSGWDEFDLF